MRLLCTHIGLLKSYQFDLSNPIYYWAEGSRLCCMEVYLRIKIFSVPHQTAIVYVNSVKFLVFSGRNYLLKGNVGAITSCGISKLRFWVHFVPKFGRSYVYVAAQIDWTWMWSCSILRRASRASRAAVGVVLVAQAPQIGLVLILKFPKTS